MDDDMCIDLQTQYGTVWDKLFYMKTLLNEHFDCHQIVVHVYGTLNCHLIMCYHRF